MIYDEKGRMKAIEELDLEGIEMVQGANNLRISAEFSDLADLKLAGYLRIKDRVDLIRGKLNPVHKSIRSPITGLVWRLSE